MIDPVSAAGAAGALAEITGSMTGMSMSQAYDAKMRDHYEPYDPVTEDMIRIGYGNYTKSTPAISGDTSQTFRDSQETDPEEAWLDWMHDGGLVSETTGGAVLGSRGSTINYSLMEDNQNDVQAVQPIAIERDTAIVTIAKALGFSMKVSEVDPVIGGKMANAMLAAGVVYDKARGLFTCWWDGVNILFPKKAVEALDDLFQEEGIIHGGGGEGQATAEGFQYPVTVSGGPAIRQSSGSGGITQYTESSSVKLVQLGSNTSSPTWISLTPFQVTVLVERPGREPVTNVYDVTTKTAGHTDVSGIDVEYYYRQVGSNVVSPILPSSPYVGMSNSSRDTAYVALYGTIVVPGDLPDGFYESNAPYYDPSSLVTAGAIAGKKAGEQNLTMTPVVPLRIPDDVSDTTLDDNDPVGATSPERTQEHEREAPIPLPIPKTKPENPEVELTNPTVIDPEKVDELVGDLANTVDPQPPQSDGLMPVPFMPGTPIDPTDPEAGSTYPSIVQSGSGLIHVYNPTPAEFISFGQWLWVTYADATIDKIWNNPFDGIIGAHELYATPGVSGRDNIRSGFLVCPTSADLVPNRYTEIDCGTVVVPEFYGNYLDYSPYSQCYIYLPFIGINEVSIDDIVGHAVNIRYRVDSYNGSCIAMIFVAKDGYKNLCYQFAGNCAVEVPLAGGSQAAIKAGMLQAEAYARATVQSAQIQKTAKIGTGIVGGAASGSGAGAINPIAGIIGGLIGALAGGTSGYIQGSADYGAAKLSAGAMQEAARYANKSSVQHSGQFGASYGAMGLKIPFIMVRNPIQVKVVNYNDDYGFPAHKRVIIGGCTGYLRVREVNVISAHATNEEKIAIETALKEGVYVS